ncbi:hypothetical protein [Asanoa siamensis]|uniref:Uncharacterized protein n=1 Tax=Asanoa siamensis TaxID=926357 RepID=A0ABQ4D3S5_9ACTN|nr:hypothetical protein [Asanoa siamensis]GIF78182.1 hypothetical protein Asi02nite_77000 [Asanoa siamensis]
MAYFSERVEPWRPLYISPFIVGPTAANRGIRAGIARLAREVEGVAWEAADDEAAVDVELHVSGEFLKPDFAGLRTGRWSQLSRVFVVQYAVPTELEGSSEEEVVGHLKLLLPGAVALAEQGLANRRNSLPTRQAGIVAGVVSAMFAQ